MISDRVDKTGYVNLEKHKWGCASGGSGGPPSLRSLETPTPMPTSLTPFFSPECPLSNTTNLRGQTTQRSVSIRSFSSAFDFPSIEFHIPCSVCCFAEISGGGNVGACSHTATTVFSGSTLQRSKLGNSYLGNWQISGLAWQNLRTCQRHESFETVETFASTECKQRYKGQTPERSLPEVWVLSEVCYLT